MSKIIIIVDGSRELGMGHIYQSLTLANSIAERTNSTSNILFLTKSDKEFTRILELTGFKVHQCRDDDEIYSVLESNKPDRVVFDKLDVSPVLAKKIKQYIKAKLVIMTNLTEANQYADITVLSDIGSNFKNIANRSKSGKVEFFGPKYWLLRPEFYKLKEKKRKPLETVRKILLIFGGADPMNFSSHVLQQLLQMKREFKIDLILGAAFPYEKELNKVMATYASRSSVSVQKNVKNVAEMMHQSDVVFASPGLSFFETLAVGAPVLGFHQNDIQRDAYQGLLPTIGKSELDQLESIIEQRKFIYPTDSFVKGLEIGMGKDDIVTEILR